MTIRRADRTTIETAMRDAEAQVEAEMRGVEAPGDVVPIQPPITVDPRAAADPDGYTPLANGDLLGPQRPLDRPRVVRGHYEHVADSDDGGWIYRAL